jgi:hypothetical protein
VFDVAPDGNRLILVLPNPDLVPPGIHVVLDWVRQLEAKTGKPSQAK